MKIVVFTDLHYMKTKLEGCPNRVGERAHEFLASVVEKVNKEIKPDILLGCGDFVNDPNDSELLAELGNILDDVNCPKIIIPGNHDPEPNVFYQTMERPPLFMDVKGFRFLPFPDDKQTAGYNAFRSAEDIERIRELGKGMRTILVQHVPLYTPWTIRCEYNYDNAEEIISACENVVLSISGHEHTGYFPSFRSPFPVLIAPALCEGRFPFLEVDLNETGKIAAFKLHYVG